MTSSDQSIENPYYAYSLYLKEKYGVPAYKVAVDGGFSCPNRGEDRSRPGCTYCEERGARATYLDNVIQLEEQVSRTLRFLKRRYGARVFLLYFQAYSGTYASPMELRRVYDSALALEDFRELIVSTRPDCIDGDRAELLASYKTETRDVWCELGIQSFHEPTLRRINRGHTVQDFHSACDLLRSLGIKITVHLIFGLPGESRENLRYSLEQINRLKPEALKIHNLHIPRETSLGREYLRGELSAPCSQRHLEYVIDALTMLDPAIIIQRLTCDTSRNRLAAPRDFWLKSTFYNRLRDEMHRRGLRQGVNFSDSVKPHSSELAPGSRQ